MSSTLCQIWFTIICPKAQNFCLFLTIRYFLNLTSLWSKCLSNNLWRDFRLPMSATVMVKKMKINFFSKSAIKTCTSYRYKCWHWKSIVCLHIIWYVLGPHANDIWTKSYCPKCTIFWVFWQKQNQNHFWHSVDAILKDVSVYETRV